MLADVERLQWLICSRCGAPKEMGRDAQALRNSWKGTPEEAEEYLNHHAIAYLECTKEHGKIEQLLFEQLEHGAYYHGHCRNASIARWNAEKNKFVYMREKFQQVYPEEIGFWTEARPGQHKFDEFRPYGKLDNPPFEIPLAAY